MIQPAVKYKVIELYESSYVIKSRLEGTIAIESFTGFVISIMIASKRASGRDLFGYERALYSLYSLQRPPMSTRALYKEPPMSTDAARLCGLFACGRLEVIIDHDYITYLSLWSTCHGVHLK